MLFDIDNIFDEGWQVLLEGSRQADHPFRNFTAANAAGEGINLYTVVLRDVDVPGRKVIFYTDARSEKVAELQADKHISALFYDRARQCQLVIRGTAEIDYQNAISLQHWRKAGYKGRTSYLAEQAPSTPVSEPTDGLAHLKGKQFDADSTEGYQNFAVVTINADMFEYLQLNRKEGNRRARFTRSGDEWQGSWIIP